MGFGGGYTWVSGSSGVLSWGGERVSPHAGNLRAGLLGPGPFPANRVETRHGEGGCELLETGPGGPGGGVSLGFGSPRAV